MCMFQPIRKSDEKKNRANMVCVNKSNGAIRREGGGRGIRGNQSNFSHHSGEYFTHSMQPFCYNKRKYLSFTQGKYEMTIYG